MDACVDPERAARVSFPSELAEGRSEGGSDQKNRRCLAEDLQHVSPLIQETYALISQGFLPPADLASEPEGEPCWTFESLAMILGIRRDKLVQILLETPRFSQMLSGPDTRKGQGRRNATAQSMARNSQSGVMT